MLLLKMIMMHFIGDYALQSDYMAFKKKVDYYVLFAHACIWTMCIIIFVPQPSPLMIGFLVIGHLIIDKIKAVLGAEKRLFFVFDQFAHFIQILIVYLMVIK